MTQEGWVEINLAMAVNDMNYTQLFMERYRLRHRAPMLTINPTKLIERLQRVKERLSTFHAGESASPIMP